jgi:hypothetical protein
MFSTNAGMMSRERPIPRPALKSSELEEVKIRVLKVNLLYFSH